MEMASGRDRMAMGKTADPIKIREGVQMSKFHSTVSRRSFMKMMAATVGGVGGAALIAPVFHDIDELASSAKGVLKRPWYVKKRDYDNPTTEIDWSLYKRHDCRYNAQSQHGRAIYYGPDKVENASNVGSTATTQRKAAGDPGYSYRNYALRAGRSSSFGTYASKAWAGFSTNATWTKGGGTAYANSQSPTDRGEPKYTGTPDDNTKILGAYLRYMGSGVSGFGELTGHNRDNVISNNHKGPTTGYTRPATGISDNVPMPSATCKNIIFDNAATVGEERAVSYVVPGAKPMFFMSMFLPGNIEMARHGWAAGQQGASQYTATGLYVGTAKFLNYLGYEMLGDDGDNGTPFIEQAAAVLTGVGESSRQGNYTLTPEYGCPGRIHNNLTDFPLAPTQPIDAGLFRFCHACHKCANSCPPNAITQDKEPTWELPQIPSTTGITANFIHQQGTKEFFLNTAACQQFFTENGNCFACYGNCTFTTGMGAMAHQLIRGMIPTVGVFDGFFYKMGEAFGYGVAQQKSEDWWDQSLPVLGTDTSRVAFDGGYSKLT